MRKRFQTGSVKKVKGKWIGQWRENGHRRNLVLGRVSELSKSAAQARVAEIVRPINNRQRESNPEMRLEDFIRDVALEVHRRRWKRSTAMTVVHRVLYHISGDLGDRPIGKIEREELQLFLDRKAAKGLSFSTVDHLRWDLHQIFSLAVEEGHIGKNPARLLVTPKSARTSRKLVMTDKEVQQCFQALPLRERLIVKMATVGGMRPGEILALQWKHMGEGVADVRQRLYRGNLDVPKTQKSKRLVGLSDGISADIAEWRRVSPSVEPDAWVFPSETLKTPLTRDNVWRRSILPRLQEVGLGWVNFQVMRRTHATLSNKLKVDPKLVADQLGHNLDVSQNVYTVPEVMRRRDAVNLLEAALQNA
jgi:integrase